MHRDWLPYLRCPVTGESLQLDATTEAGGRIVEGRLVTASGRAYPITGGIPRFAQAIPAVASFGFEWGRWPRVQFEDENVGRRMAGFTTAMWERITGQGTDFAGQVIAEFGCGAGRYLDVVRRKGGRAIGIELSGAAEVAQRNFADDPDVLIIQADLFAPPLAPGAVDGCYCIGVLHHTADPGRGVSAIAHVVRPGGWVAIVVYERGSFYDWNSVRRHRYMNTRLKPLLGYLSPIIYSYFSAYLLYYPMRVLYDVPGLRNAALWATREWLPVVRLPDPHWRVLDTFDAVTAHFASTHTEEEVREWLAAAGLGEVRRTDWCSTAAVGVRR
jgi:SAM-dependent methyltransferase